MGVAVADGEAVCEARKALGHTVNVASDTLLQAWHFDFAAADGNVASGGVVKVDLVGRLDGLFGSQGEGEVTSSTPSVWPGIQLIWPVASPVQVMSLELTYQELTSAWTAKTRARRTGIVENFMLIDMRVD